MSRLKKITPATRVCNRGELLNFYRAIKLFLIIIGQGFTFILTIKRFKE